MAPAPVPDLASRLLEAAVDRFGQAGFEGASTRDIASACGTAMSSITYHFGGKQGLYLACADHIAAQIQASHRPGLTAIAANPPQDAESARAALLLLLEGFGRLMLAPESERWSQFIVREQQQPTEAFERLYAQVMQPVLETAIRLIALVRPALSEKERRNLVINVVGMALVLRLGRACVSRVMGLDDKFDEPTNEMLIAGLRRTANELLTEA